MNPPGMRFCMNCGFNVASGAAAPASVAAPVAAPVAAAAAPQPGAVVLILTALRADKTEVGSHPLHGATTVGRDTGGIFAGDSYLSPRHATFTPRGGKMFVRDESSLNGTFIKLAHESPVELRPGDVFRIGQEIVRFDALVPQPPSPDGVERLGSPSKGYVGRLALVIGRDVTGNAFPVPEAGVHLGRERGDILFPEDGYVSGLHCRIRSEGGRVTLTDLGSSNGTFVRITSERELKSGDEILMGQQLFRITIPLRPWTPRFRPRFASSPPSSSATGGTSSRSAALPPFSRSCGSSPAARWRRARPTRPRSSARCGTASPSTSTWGS